jgi:Zn-dependent protease with chaperone function
MAGVDFDFARYVAHRRGLIEQRARDGAAYSYLGERKLRRALISARPVTLALEATTRAWRSRGREELLASSVKASDRDYPAVYSAGERAAATLGLKLPPIVIADPAALGVSARALGMDDDPVVALSRPLVERLSPAELTAVIGHELGHVQNDHIVYVTALYYLQHRAMILVRWAVRPALVALQAWSRRAEVTCDRAALVATRDLKAALTGLIRLEVPDVDDARIAELLRSDTAAEVGGFWRYAEFFRSHPDIVKRVRALHLFALSAFYQKLSGESPGGPDATGLTADEVDTKVGEIMSVF